MLSIKERVEQEFGEFITWLQSRGIGNPYYYFSKETWDFVIWQRDFTVFQRAQQEKAQSDQQFANLAQALKDPAKSKTAILAAVMGWGQDQRDDLLILLTPPAPLPDEPPSDVQADASRVPIAVQ